MILATIYFLIFCFWVKRHSFFKDDVLSFKVLLSILVLKVMGCVAYYGIYFYYYTGGFQGDSASTMKDASVIYNALPNHVNDFFKMIIGWHSNLETDPLYDIYFKYIDKWGKADVTTEFFLNDNRTPIRINALIMLFSFGHYAAHALVMLVLSFIGQMAFYKIVKRFFSGKELLLAIIIFVTPSILFWTSGVLKEPISVFLLGIFTYSFFKLFIDHLYKTKYFVVLLTSSLLFLILKPYILFLLLIPLVLYFIVRKYQVKRVLLFYAIGIAISYSSVIVTLKYVWHKDVINTIIVRQNDFINLSKGGIFFLNDTYYLRLDYKDIKQFTMLDEKTKICIIKPHAKLMYWDIYHLNDTIFVNDNQDTAQYKLLAVNAPAGSGIVVKRLEHSFVSFAMVIPQAIFNVLCRPFFFDSHSSIELIASLENLLLILFCIICLIYRQKGMPYKNEVGLCLSIVVLAFILIGLTTTVMGAIVRYKVPFLPFLLMIPLLYLDPKAIKRIPIIKRLVK